MDSVCLIIFIVLIVVIIWLMFKSCEGVGFEGGVGSNIIRPAALSVKHAPPPTAQSSFDIQRMMQSAMQPISMHDFEKMINDGMGRINKLLVDLEIDYPIMTSSIYYKNFKEKINKVSKALYISITSDNKDERERWSQELPNPMRYMTRGVVKSFKDGNITKLREDIAKLFDAYEQIFRNWLDDDIFHSSYYFH